MKAGAIIGVLSTALILAALFALGGAGLYGSPFGSGKTAGQYAIYAAAILVGPIASLLALVYHRRLPDLAGVVLVLGGLAGVFLGLVVESDFRYVWGKVFVILVWLPMSLLGARRLLSGALP